MPYKVLIADDEQLARQAIRLALPLGDPVTVVADCADGRQAMDQIQKHMPDIIFLDIQMPGLTGIEVLGRLPAAYEPYLVIVSAHDNYALAAFEHDASDYLLKPFSQERFDKTMKKALKHVEMRQQSRRAFRHRLIIRNGANLEIVPCENISFIEAMGDYTTVHASGRKYLHTESLSSLENVLDPENFVRTHRSYIVNLRFISELTSHANGDYTIMLKNDQSLKLSRNYREKVMQLIG